MKTWTLELTHNETIALARAIAAHLEELKANANEEDTFRTIKYLVQIASRFPDDENFEQIKRRTQIKEKSLWN